MPLTLFRDHLVFGFGIFASSGSFDYSGGDTLKAKPALPAPPTASVAAAGAGAPMPKKAPMPPKDRSLIADGVR